MKVKIKKYNPNFKESCEMLKNFSKSVYSKRDKYKNESKEFYKKNGFHYEDCWNLDSWMIVNILPRLIYFKNNNTGYPGEFFNKYSEEKAIKKWNKILDSIIAAFQVMIKENCFLFNDNNESYRKNKEKIIKQGFKNLIKYYNNLWF